MKAVVRRAYGAVEVAELEKPEPGPGEVLVRVHAASLNAHDWYTLMGRPYAGRIQMGLRRPRSERLGTDYAGVVEAVADGVTEFRPGDEVLGGKSGALAEHVSVLESGSIVTKPANLSVEQAGAVGIAGLTALQGLRDKGGLQPGQSVLVNGASGGVGTFAVQIAKALGAEVTAVCSTRNVEQARALGADHVVDYTRDDFTRSGARHDVILDVAGTRAWPDLRRVLRPSGKVVIVGGPKSGRMFGPFGHMLGTKLAGRSRVSFFLASFNKPDMLALHELLEGRKVTPVVSERYALADVADAFRSIGAGHAQGKIVVTID